jgi:hypothetical protein
VIAEMIKEAEIKAGVAAKEKRAAHLAGDDFRKAKAAKELEKQHRLIKHLTAKAEPVTVGEVLSESVERKAKKIGPKTTHTTASTVGLAAGFEAGVHQEYLWQLIQETSVLASQHWVSLVEVFSRLMGQ